MGTATGNLLLTNPPPHLSPNSIVNRPRHSHGEVHSLTVVRPMLHVTEAHHDLILPSHSDRETCLNNRAEREYDANNGFHVIESSTPLGAHRGPHGTLHALIKGEGVRARKLRQLWHILSGRRGGARTFISNGGAEKEDAAFLGVLREPKLILPSMSPLPQHPHHLRRSLEERQHAGHEIRNHSMVPQLLNIATFIYNSDVCRTFDFSTEIP